jgi:hypothetical protein
MKFVAPVVLSLGLLFVAAPMAHAADATLAQKMDAVRACAAGKGVTLPAPPHRNVPKVGPRKKGEKPVRPQATGPVKGTRTKLTDEQRLVVNDCYTAQGLQAPWPDLKPVPKEAAPAPAAPAPKP